jgi:hypothetical protein
VLWRTWVSRPRCDGRSSPDHSQACDFHQPVQAKCRKRWCHEEGGQKKQRQHLVLDPQGCLEWWNPACQQKPVHVSWKDWTSLENEQLTQKQRLEVRCVQNEPGHCCTPSIAWAASQGQAQALQVFLWLQNTARPFSSLVLQSCLCIASSTTCLCQQPTCYLLHPSSCVDTWRMGLGLAGQASGQVTGSQLWTPTSEFSMRHLLPLCWLPCKWIVDCFPKVVLTKNSLKCSRWWPLSRRGGETAHLSDKDR